LQRYLATAGVAARRKAEELIAGGRVTVNGAVVTVLGTKIDPDRDSVLVDGEAVVALDRFYVLFNKPKGCITAVSDDRGRPTVMDYLPNLPVPVKPVGRLDFYTEGVLLLTNDGDLAARLLAPASHVPKTYHVKVHGRLAREHIEALRDGIRLDDGTTTMPAEIEILPGESKHTWLGITIHEGKHRQIHRMIEALGYQVDKLQRVAFANLTFHELRVGDARELTQQELNALRDAVGLDHSAVARGRWRKKREATDIPRRARAKARAEAEAEAETEAAAVGPAPGRRAGEGDPGHTGSVAEFVGSVERASARGGQIDSDRAEVAGRGNIAGRRREGARDASSSGGSRGRSGRSGSSRADSSRTAGPSRSRERAPGKAGRDRAAAPRSGGWSGPPRPRPAGGSGAGRREDRDNVRTASRTAGGRWERPAGGGGARDARSGPGRGRTWDAERDPRSGAAARGTTRPGGGRTWDVERKPRSGTAARGTTRPGGGRTWDAERDPRSGAAARGSTRPGPGRTRDVERVARGRGEQRSRDGGRAEDSGGRRSPGRAGGGGPGKGQGRSFGTRAPQRGRGK
jgi:23S rRNA pseudouridine2605 synthase